MVLCLRLSIMTFELKDIIYICTYVVSVTALFISFNYRVRGVEKKNQEFKKVLFGEQGKLNFTDQDTCKMLRDQIYNTIRKSESMMESIQKEISRINENVIKVMVLLERYEKDRNK